MSRRCAGRPGWLSNGLLCWTAATVLLAATGCRSRFIQASIENEGGAPLRVVELDYPGAGFGVSTLAAHGSYNYRFKLLGSGPLTLTYTDGAGKLHASTGPSLQEGQEGTLLVKVGQDGQVRWQPVLH